MRLWWLPFWLDYREKCGDRGGTWALCKTKMEYFCFRNSFMWKAMNSFIFKSNKSIYISWNISFFVLSECPIFFYWITFSILCISALLFCIFPFFVESQKWINKSIVREHSWTMTVHYNRPQVVREHEPFRCHISSTYWLAYRWDVNLCLSTYPQETNGMSIVDCLCFSLLFLHLNPSFTHTQNVLPCTVAAPYSVYTFPLSI